MYQDVEIIEEGREIIEISDDDCPQNEDSKSFHNEIVDIVSPDVPAELNNSRSSLNTEITCVLLEDETAAPANNIDSNFVTVNNSETNGINRNCNFKTGTACSRLEANIETTNDCKEAILENVSSRARKRKRRRIVRKSLQNALIGKNQVDKVVVEESVEKETNSASNIDQNEPNILPIADTAKSSSNAIIAPCATNNHTGCSDFSKLKWLKPLSSLSTPPHLQIVIIDRSHPFWRIDNDKWLMIEKRLLEALNTEMIQSNDASIGLFEGAKWQRGIKILGCLNENSFTFIKNFIINLDKLWRGAKLDAFSISDINNHVLKAYIPPPTLKTDLIMSLIKLQNPSICTKDWVIIREQENPYRGGLDIWIRVSDKSFVQLGEKRGELKYGVNRVWLNPTH